MAEPEVIILGEYRGKPIHSASARFRKMGDGLAKAMEIEGAIDEPGTLVTFVIRTRVGPHKLILSEDEEYYDIDIDYLGGTVARIDDDIVAESLNTMERRIKAKEDAEREAKTGEHSMPGVKEAADAPGAGASRLVTPGDMEDPDLNPNNDSRVPAAGDDGYQEGDHEDADLVSTGASSA